jgi:transaldolase
MTRLHALFNDFGQSPWLDNIQRSYLQDGTLSEMISQGIRGVTSNPTIFAKAVESSDLYDAQLASLAASMPIEQCYWEMMIEDISDALELFLPLYEQSMGTDGFVSLEVSPHLAHDTEGTVAQARMLHERIRRPNLLVKIPATVEGIPAIRTMIAEGHSVNVTLIFSLERYREVIDAYLAGMEELVASGAPRERVASVASVASFFVSRVDTEVDRRLESLVAQGALPEASGLAGTAALAQARLAYQLFVESFSDKRWEALAEAGARTQRPLWASTSTKNPAYPDLKYVDGLIGPDTVDTMPDATVAAFLDHGTLARTVDADVEQAKVELEKLREAGVDMDDVVRVLEDEGVAAFAKSFDEAVDVLTTKAAELR